MTTRRRFIGGGVVLALAAGTGLTPTRAANPPLPAVGLGSWITFNVGNDPQGIRRSRDVVAAFVDAGGGMIDSSPMYGSSQDTIGKALADLDYPASVYHAEKVWTGSTAAGRPQIEASARKWGVERFDLLQVHNLKNWEGHLETLQEMKANGEITHIGVTTSHGRRHDLLETVLERQPLDFVQLTYNPVDREVEDRLLPLARERNMGVIVNRPFQRGSLTRHLSSAALPSLAQDIGATSWAQLILAFILSHPAVTVVIPATTRVDHVRENKAAEQLPQLDAALREAVADAIDQA